MEKMEWVPIKSSKVQYKRYLKEKLVRSWYNEGFDLDDLIIESKQILHGKSPSLRKIEDIDVYERYNFS